MLLGKDDWTPEDFTRVFKDMGFNGKPLMITFDVDCTLIGALIGEVYNVRPGAVEVLRFLKDQGHEIHLWSTGRKRHCMETADFLGVTDLITDFHDKPSYPMVLSAVLETFNGRMPDVSVDDDPTERVAPMAFIQCTEFWGDISSLM